MWGRLLSRGGGLRLMQAPTCQSKLGTQIPSGRDGDGAAAQPHRPDGPAVRPQLRSLSPVHSLGPQAACEEAGRSCAVRAQGEGPAQRPHASAQPEVADSIQVEKQWCHRAPRSRGKSKGPGTSHRGSRWPRTHSGQWSQVPSAASVRREPERQSCTKAGDSVRSPP